MQSRSPIQFFFIILKGIAMGAADVVPGVSGGTIAFISGIYEELIQTIHKLDLGFFKIWKKEGFRASWRHYNLSFLIALFGGVLFSILSLAKLISWLLKAHPIIVWSFFFGLILASILYVGKQVTKWNTKVIIAMIIATILSYLITIAEPMGSPESTWFLLFAGSIAIIAMILPGISGAFILLLLGAYESIIGTITNFVEGITTLNWDLFSTAFARLFVFAMGAVIGLKIFSRALNWMFTYHKNTILAVLTGFMIGALNKIWPWKEVLSTRINHSGEEIPFLEKSISPISYDGEPLISYAIIFIVAGFLTIFLLERVATSKSEAT